MSEPLRGLRNLFWLTTLAGAVGLGACDSEVEPDPSPAKIEFLSSLSTSICQEIDLRARVRDANGLDVSTLMINDVAVAESNADNVEQTLIYRGKSQPSNHEFEGRRGPGIRNE